MPDVRLPDGTIVRNVPPNITQAELMARVNAKFARDLPAIEPGMGPSSPFDDAHSAVQGEKDLMSEVHRRAQAGNRQIPFFQRLQNDETVSAEQGRNALPLLAASALGAAPGGVLGSALLFGAGGAGGELLKNAIPGGEPVSLGQAAETGAGFTRDALLGGMAGKAFSPIARYVFGRPASAGAEQAIEFANRRALELDDEAAAIARRTPGEARPSSNNVARELGYPRLPLDSVTDGTLLDGVRFLISGAAPSNARAKQAAVFINNELASFVGEVPKAAGIVNDAKQLVFADPKLRALRQFDRIDDPDKWIDSVISGSNSSALLELARSSPEIHRQLLAKNLENVFREFSRPSPGLGPRVLDGAGLRKWFEGNREDIVKTYGYGIGTKLDDFTNYAQYLDGAVESAEKGLGGSIGTLGLLGRSAAEAGGMGFLPHIMVPTQASAWVLGNTLMNPSSATFKFFAALPKTGRAARTAVQEESARHEVGGGLPNPADLFTQ